MSEHPVVAFLLAAHQQAEELARAAAGVELEAVDYLWETKYLNVRRPDGGTTHTTEFSAELADHFALHDPASVLRRVAAERKILAEHQPTREAKWRGPTSLDPCDLPGCACNGVPEDSLEAWEIDGCRVCASGSWYDAVVEHWPCRMVRLLAEAWGWTEEAS